MNSNSIRKIALIPAYQPDEKLISTVNSLRKKGFRIVVTDDGSGQEYSNIFAKVKKYAAVLSYPINHGKGYALKTGIHYIRRKFSGNYVIVTVDADGQHTPEDAEEAAELAYENAGSLVIGARKPDKTAPLRSRFGNSVTKHVFNALAGTSITDTQTGLRAFSDDLSEYIMSIRGSRYEYEMNMLMQCADDNISIIEFPIKTIYIDNNSSSHFNPVKDSARIYKAIFRFKKNKGRKKH